MILLRQVKTVKWYGALAVLADAPIIVLLVIAAFAFGDQLPGIGDRLADRKAMWLSQWNNDVFGGDHLAHSYWTLASGGLTGQGPGRGFPNTMPAAHTDMILPSIGEELGWLGLVAIFLLFGILMHRSFLCTACGTTIQFLFMRRYCYCNGHSVPADSGWFNRVTATDRGNRSFS